MKAKREIKRMCVGCGQMFDKRELIRVVKSPEGEIGIDLTGKKNGRGAYICNNPECLKKAKKKTLPFEARLTAAAEMLPKALALVHRKKAPALLVTFIKDNLDHIRNDDDWFAYHRHLEAIGGYLSMPAIIKE